MSKLRSFLIKVCSLILGVCATVGVLTMANASNVSAAEPMFIVYDGGAIRLNVGTEGENYSGLRFRGYVNTEWYASQGVEAATFGTLIYPAKNGTVDTNKSSTENMNALDGNNVIWRYYNAQAFIGASIVFDDIVILNAIAEKYNAELGTSYTYESPEVIEKLGVVKAELYAMDFTAYPYAIANNKTYWAENSYTTSMQKVAARTLVSIKDGATADENGAIKSAALSYVGSWDEKYYSGYASVVDKEVVIDGIENYQVSDDAIVVLGNENAIVKDGKITLAGEYTASRTPQKLYIFEEGSLKVVNLLLVDNVLKTAEDVRDFFDKSTWAEGENKFDDVMVLGSDVDMSTVEGSYGLSNSFSGYFDGRGHVISNLTKNTTSNANPIFGDLANSTIIKNLAFDNFTSIGYNVNNGWFAKELRGTVENIYVRFAPGSESQQMFMYTRAGYFNNVIIEAPYDNDLDADAWALANAGAWGRTYLSRAIGVALTTNMTNVKVISQLPLVVHGETSNYKEPTYTNGAVSKWESWFAYGENETRVWHDFNFFHTATDDATAPGLGVAEDAQNVQNTQVIVDGQSMHQGVTRVWKGIKRYDTLEEMVANNPDDVQAFVNTGMWKFENGNLTWANGENVTNYIGGEYDASQNALLSTALNGEKIEKVTVNGVELSLENEEYTVDENGYLTSIYAKTSDSDTKNGISYKLNSANNDILDEVVIYTENCVYTLNDVNYYTRIIDSAEELKLALDINYTQNQGGTSGNGILYNTYTDGVEYVFNAGIYKLNSNIDMSDVTLNYTGMTISTGNFYKTYYVDNTVLKGGFTGSFDGAGYVIDNFTPGKHGMFGTLGTIGSGLTTGANIKNVAFTNVLTYQQTTYDFYPVIASFVPSTETIAQNISDVYVSYSQESTDMFGLIARVTKNLYMKNVYVVNEQGYNAITEEWKDLYSFTDGTTTLESDRHYRNFFHSDNNGSHYGYTSSLFTSVYGMESISDSYIKNVVIASPSSVSFSAPISFTYQYLFSIDYQNRTATLQTGYPTRMSCFHNSGLNGVAKDAYFCNSCGDAFASESCGNGCVDTTFTKKTKSTSRFAKFQAYGINEMTGNIPFPVELKAQLTAELAEKAVIEDGEITKNTILNKIKKSEVVGYICDTCGKNVSFYSGTACTLDGCTGTMNVMMTSSNSIYHTSSTNCGIYSSPLAYNWAFPDLSKFSTTNLVNKNSTYSIVRFKGVTRYDTVSEVTANCNFSGFTSKVWTIAEDGSLNWTSLYNAQA